MRKIFFDKYLSKIAGILPQWLTPNMITVSRLVLIIPIIIFLFAKMWVWFAAFFVLCLASDALDGTLSRVRKTYSKFGALLDPTVDKLLFFSIFCVYLPSYPLFIAIIIFLDAIVAISGLTVILYYKKNRRELPILGANIYGKMKVVFQSACIFAFIYRDLFFKSDLNYLVANLLLIATIILSCISIYMYIKVLKCK